MQKNNLKSIFKLSELNDRNNCLIIDLKNEIIIEVVERLHRTY